MKTLTPTQPEKIKNISLHEAAEAFHISYSAFCSLLDRYPEIKEKYVQKEVYKGRRRFVIEPEGMLVLANMKDSDRGNKKIKTGMIFRESKKKIAERAIAEVKQHPPTGIEALKQLQVVIAQQIENYEAIGNQGKKIEQLDERVSELEGDTSKMPITESQRKRLHERVTNLHYQLLEKRRVNTPFRNIWLKVHEATGKSAVSEYTFEDYRFALSFLKDTYKRLNIEW